MSVPRVSVVVTCYNLGPFLAEAVASVRSQTFQDLEIVIVDDGSDDSETVRALDEQRQAGARVLRTENRGLSAARNWGASHTSGEFLCMVDADDRLAPTLLEKSIAVLDADPAVGFVSHWLRTFGDEEWEWTPTSCDLGALLDKNTVNGAALMRREVFDGVGGFDESMRSGCEDWDFWLTAVERGCRGYIIPEVLFYYRRRPDSMSRVMMAGATYALLYSELAKKHAASFRVHAEALVVSRETELFDLRAHIRDLDSEYAEWLRPEVGRHFDEVTRLERRLDVHQARVALARERSELAAMLAAKDQALGQAHDEVARTRADADRLATDAERARAEAGRATADAMRAHEEAVRARAEVDAVRRSWSWRVSAPLRRLYDLVARTGRS
jgi:glycosyltransferase involved in cell wall biosynthesis